MISKKLICFMLLGGVILVPLLIYFFQPLVLRRSYISRIAQLDIPRSAQIVEYRFGITSFGIEPFFAKIRLSQEEYEVLRRYFIVNQEDIHVFSRMKQDFNYQSLSIDDIVEIGLRDRLTRRTSIFLVGSSRLIQIIIVETSNGEHFLYVFY